MNIGLQLPWDPADIDSFLATARLADEAGVHSLWVNEGFGHDAFSGLAILARETRRVLLGTSIVNVYSRTPGALAQHFATIDELSGGRVIAGLGASAPGVIERFHGRPFTSPLRRLRETADLLRLYWTKERFTYTGSTARVERALELGARPVQQTLPIFFATMAPASVRMTAAVADGWLPAWIPDDRLGGEVRRLRALATEAGRDPGAVLVRSPGTTVVAVEPDEVARTVHRLRGTLAFFIARNGEFYFRQFARQGLEAEALSVRHAWAEGGRELALAALPAGLEQRFGFVGDIDACVAHIARQDEIGVDIHMVSLAPSTRTDAAGLLRRIVEGSSS